MSEEIENRLKKLGIELPEGSAPAAVYANAVIVNGLMFVAGKEPAGEPKGKLGETYTTQQGYAFARQTGIQILAVLKSELGSLNRVKLSGWSSCKASSTRRRSSKNITKCWTAAPS